MAINARNLCLGVLAGVLVGAAGADSKPDLTGVWILNADLSQEQVKTRRGGSGMGASISVGPVGVPLPGSAPASPQIGKLKDPDVLFCQQLEIAVVDDVVVLRYEGLGEEEMRPGKHQGKKVRWTGKKLSETYETTSRRVSKKFELIDEYRMKVVVRLNPNHGDTRTFTKIFDRAGTQAESG